MKIRTIIMSLAVGVGLAFPAVAQQTAICKDGSDWSGNSRSGACARHGGVKEWTTSATAPARTTTVPPSQVAPSSTPAMHPDQFSSEADARTHCPGAGQVVWMNTQSNIYHFAGNKNYGNTKQGAYMCRADADKAGRAAKNEKAPPTR
jgi:hypothetical protein